jgi:hypothetical protein
MTMPTRVRLLGGVVRRATGPIATMDEAGAPGSATRRHRA